MSIKQPYIIWQRELNTDFPTIDNQHRKIIGIANELHSSLLNNNLGDVIPSKLMDLTKYSRIHFHFEERMLRHNEYPLYHEHICYHDAFVGRLSHLEKEMATLGADRDRDFGWKILKFVSKWWLNHILKEDKKYMVYLESLI